MSDSGPDPPDCNDSSDDFVRPFQDPMARACSLPPPAVGLETPSPKVQLRDGHGLRARPVLGLSPHAEDQEQNGRDQLPLRRTRSTQPSSTATTPTGSSTPRRHLLPVQKFSTIGDLVRGRTPEKLKSRAATLSKLSRAASSRVVVKAKDAVWSSISPELPLFSDGEIAMLRQEFDKFAKSKHGELTEQQFSRLIFSRIYKTKKAGNGLNGGMTTKYKEDGRTVWDLSTQRYRVDATTSDLLASNVMRLGGLSTLSFAKFVEWNQKSSAKTAKKEKKDAALHSTAGFLAPSGGGGRDSSRERISSRARSAFRSFSPFGRSPESDTRSQSPTTPASPAAG
eukprot:CAMPEP_0173398662 /NCGR_PEP_ID=MMETSP1356-20130122/42461_1 /TAXON_ID=77927 ORGANISM="Hemiselmis virescens, Strain PCC157" /NCGR_SAMPLE_ID=MMETSP1356 /ASSEMBLY_ACC=CAM_ASM_000847 /LENGTH=338 /DNA_ID=CAMNT_0014358219 /DNA_START=70 /DNA_END=1082 /DNA_ORIENTATION=-